MDTRGWVEFDRGVDGKMDWGGALESDSPGFVSLLCQLPSQQTSWLLSFPI